jgi:hypothetical protein
VEKAILYRVFRKAIDMPAVHANPDPQEIRNNAVANAVMAAGERPPASFDPALMRSLIDALAEYAEQTKPAAGPALRAGAGNAALNAVSEAIYAMVSNAASAGQAFNDVHNDNKPLLKPASPGYDQQQYNGMAAVAMGQLAQSTVVGLGQGLGVKSDFALPAVSPDLKASLRDAAAEDGRMNDAQVEQFQDGLRNMNPAQALSVAQFAEKVAKDNPQSHAAGQLAGAAFEVAAAKAENFYGLPMQNPELLAEGERNRAGGVANWLGDAALGNQESGKADSVLSRAQRGRDAWAPAAEQTSQAQPHRPELTSQQPTSLQRVLAGTQEVLTSSLRFLVEKATSAGMANTPATKVEPGHSKADFMEASMFSGRQINISAVVGTFNVMAAAIKDLQSHQMGLLPQAPASADRPASANALDGVREGLKHFVEKAPGKMVDSAVGQALAHSLPGTIAGELKGAVYPGAAVNGMARVATAAAMKELVALANKPAAELIKDHAAGQLLDKVRDAADQVSGPIGNAVAAQRSSEAAATRGDALLRQADVNPDDVKAAVAEIKQHAADAREAANGLREAAGSAPRLVELAAQVAQRAVKVVGLTDPRDQQAVRDQLNSPQAGDVPSSKRDAISALDLAGAARDALPALQQAAQRAERAADTAQAQPQRLAERFGDRAADAADRAKELQQAGGERAPELANQQANIAERAAGNAAAAAGVAGNDPANPTVAVQIDARPPAQEAAHQAQQHARAAREDANSAGAAATDGQRAGPRSNAGASLSGSDSSNRRSSEQGSVDSLRSDLTDLLDGFGDLPSPRTDSSSSAGSAPGGAAQQLGNLTPQQADRLAQLQDALARNGGASSSKDAAEQNMLEALARGDGPAARADSFRSDLTALLDGIGDQPSHRARGDASAERSAQPDGGMQIGHGPIYKANAYGSDPVKHEIGPIKDGTGKELSADDLGKLKPNTEVTVEVDGRQQQAKVVQLTDDNNSTHAALKFPHNPELGFVDPNNGKEIDGGRLLPKGPDGEFHIARLRGGVTSDQAQNTSDRSAGAGPSNEATGDPVQAQNMARAADGMANKANQAAETAEKAQADADKLGDSATKGQVKPLHDQAGKQADVAQKAADNANAKADSAKAEALAACGKAGITSNQQLEDLNRKEKKDPDALSADEKGALKAARSYEQAKAAAAQADDSAAKAKTASNSVATRFDNAAPDPQTDSKPQATDTDTHPPRVGGKRAEDGDKEQNRIMQSLMSSDEGIKAALKDLKVKRGDLQDLDTRGLADNHAQRARDGDSANLTQADVNLLNNLYDKLPPGSNNRHGDRSDAGLTSEQLKGLQAELALGNQGALDDNTLTDVAKLGKPENGGNGTQRNHRVGNSAVSNIAEVAATLAQTASPETVDKIKPLMSELAQTVGNISKADADTAVNALMDKDASPAERKRAAMEFVEKVADSPHNLRLGEIDTLGNAMDANRNSAGDPTPRSQRDMDTLKEIGQKIDGVINDLSKDSKEVKSLQGLADLMDAAVQPNRNNESSSQAAGLQFGADPASTQAGRSEPRSDAAQAGASDANRNTADRASTSAAAGTSASAANDAASQPGRQGANQPTNHAANQPTTADRSTPNTTSGADNTTPTSGATQAATATAGQGANDANTVAPSNAAAGQPNHGAATQATTADRSAPNTTSGAAEPTTGTPSAATPPAGTTTDRSAPSSSQSSSADGSDSGNRSSSGNSSGSSAGRGTDNIARSVDGEDDILDNPDADGEVGSQVEDNTTGVGAGASGSAGVTQTEDGGYAAAAQGSAGATAQAGGEFGEEGDPVSGSGSVQVGPQAEGSASAHVGPGEVEGSVEGSVSVAEAEGEATVGNDDFSQTWGGSGTVGAGGTANGGISTTGASGQVDAFAGAEATATSEQSVAGGAATTSTEVGALAGVGLGAGANVGADDGVLTLGMNGKIALGIGISFDFSLKIDFNKITGKEVNPFQGMADGLNEINGGKTQYSGAQLEFYARAYVKDNPGEMTAEQLLQKMADDGLVTQRADGTVALGGTPTTDGGRQSLSWSILSTGGGAGATNVNAQGLAKAINFANMGDTETNEKAQALINIYGDGQTIDKAGLDRAMKDGALSYGNVETVHNGQKQTSWGLKFEPNLAQMSDERMGQMLSTSTGDGATLAATINNMNTQYYGSKEAYVGDAQAQFALNAYAAYGEPPNVAMAKMKRDGVLTTTPDGSLTLELGAMAANCKSADPTLAKDSQHRMASALLTSGGQGFDGSLDANGLAHSLNEANRGEADYGPQMEQMVRLYGGADGRVDHNELQAMARDGVISFGNMQSTFNGQAETISGMSIQPPSLAGRTDADASMTIATAAGADGSVNAQELQSWCAPGTDVNQLNVLMHGYNRSGELTQVELQAMIGEGVLKVDANGKLQADPLLMARKAGQGDALAQERYANMLTTYGTDSGDTSSDHYKNTYGLDVPERITSAENMARAMNEMAGAQVVTPDQVPGITQSFTSMNATDHTNLRENNVRYAVACGAITLDPATGLPVVNTTAYA